MSTMPHKLPKISVIVPVYNAEKWLSRCIDSILAQTFTDFELLLINDGSSDSSGAICDEYAEKDSRIRVFHKPNGGVSSARNLGLDNATGEWITFCDADDWVEKETFSIVPQTLSVKKTDIIVFSFKVESSNVGDFSISFPKGFYEGDSLRDLFISYGMSTEFTGVLCKFYRRSILTNYHLRFVIGIDTHEDTLFFLSYLVHVYSIALIPEKYYHYLPFNGLSRNLDNAVNQLSRILILYNATFDALNRFHFPDEMRVKFRHSVAWLALCHTASIKSPVRMHRHLQFLIKDPVVMKHFSCDPPYSRMNILIYKALRTKSPIIATIALLMGRRLRPKVFLR